MKPCPYCEWNDDHPYHYPDCPALEIATLRSRVAVLEKAVEWAINAPEGWCGISKIFQDDLRRRAKEG